MLQEKRKQGRRDYLSSHQSSLQVILDHWSLGRLVTIDTDIPGWANLNCLVETEKGHFFLRLTSVERRSLIDLQAEIAALNHLTDKKFPVVKPITNPDGRQIVEGRVGDNDYFALLFPIAAGEHVEFPDPPQVEAMGETLGKLHQDLADFPGNQITRKFNFLHELNDLDFRVKEKYQYMWPYPEVIEENSFKSEWEDAFTKFHRVFSENQSVFETVTLSHGDFHQENLRFNGGAVTTVLDFDNLILAPRIFDISISLHHLKYRHHQTELDYEQTVKTFLKGYEKTLSLSNREKDLLVVLTQFWLWGQVPWLHYYSGHIPGHREIQAESFKTTLTGIRELGSLRLD